MKRFVLLHLLSWARGLYPARRLKGHAGEEMVVHSHGETVRCWAERIGRGLEAAEDPLCQIQDLRLAHMISADESQRAYLHNKILHPIDGEVNRIKTALGRIGQIRGRIGGSPSFVLIGKSTYENRLQPDR